MIAPKGECLPEKTDVRPKKADDCPKMLAFAQKDCPSVHASFLLPDLEAAWSRSPSELLFESIQQPLEAHPPEQTPVI